MRIYVPVGFPDACSGCGEPLGEEEQRLGVLVSRGVPQGTPSELGALYEAESFHAACAPPSGTPGRVIGGVPSAAQGRPQRSNRYGPDHFIGVAAVYRDAHARGLAPTLHVATSFGIARSTAGHWVMECRELGLLPRTGAGRAAA